jgi:non-ribosomal peptide synthetase component E (peptide arylation enzyme)
MPRNIFLAVVLGALIVTTALLSAGAKPTPVVTFVSHSEAEIKDYGAPEREARYVEDALQKRFDVLLGFPTMTPVTRR